LDLTIFKRPVSLDFGIEEGLARDCMDPICMCLYSICYWSHENVSALLKGVHVTAQWYSTSSCFRWNCILEYQFLQDKNHSARSSQCRRHVGNLTKVLSSWTIKRPHLRRRSRNFFWQSPSEETEGYDIP